MKQIETKTQRLSQFVQVQESGGNEIVFVPRGNVTITSVTPVGGKVIVNGEVRDRLPVEYGAGDHIVVTSTVVGQSGVIMPIEIDWMER